MKAKFLALAALVLGMVSCQTDVVEGLHVDANGEAELTLQVGLPEATRAAGEDSALGAIGNINMAEYDIRYVLNVYDEKGDLAKGPISQFEDVSTSTQFSLRLVPGRQYKFVVWADFVKQGEQTALHYDVRDFAEIKTLTAQNPMDETRDAYTGFHVEERFSNTSNISFKLTRPFAKLRVVTTDMKELYSDLVSAKVVYTSRLYTSFNAIEAKAIGLETSAGVERNVDFSTMTYANESNPRTDGGKMTLFADYLFGAEDNRVMFTLDVADETGIDIPEIAFNTNIPVERNHLTTVMGKILTDANTITVTIDKDFAAKKTWPETDAEQLAYVAMFGGEVTLSDNVTVAEGFQVVSPMVVNLNGKTLKYTGNDVLFRVKNGATLTINGNENNSKIVTNPDTNGGDNAGNGYVAFVYEGATLNINGGNYDAQETCTIAQASGGKIYVTGGTFKAQAYTTNGVSDHRYTFNHSDSMKDVGLIEITGGKFYKWNPAESHSESPAMSFIPADYCSYPVNDYYEVMSWDVAKTKTFTTPKNKDQAYELLRAVFRHGGNVKIKDQNDGSDVDVTEALIAETRDVVISGSGEIYLKNGVESIYKPGVVSALICAKNGVTVKFNDYSGYVSGNNEDYAIETRGGNIVVNSGIFRGAVSAAYALEGTITINGGTFEENGSSYGPQYLLNCHDANYTEGKANIVVKGGSFKGFNPADNTAEGPNTNFVAASYTAKNTNGTWTVSK